MKGTAPILIRPATPADAAIIAHQRAAMCLDVGTATPELAVELEAACAAWFPDALARGDYLGWLAFPADDPATIIAGAGVQRRQAPPFPRRLPDGRLVVGDGRQAVVLNVYTEPAYRRRGAARLLMLEILAWARAVDLERLVLHAAPDGKPLYQSLGFSETNEMRWDGR